MSNGQATPRFFYRANALALGGRFKAPVPADIATQATTSLPTIGGLATATAPAFSQGRVGFSVGADSFVSGSDDGTTFTTRARATVTGLDVLGILTATAVGAELVSTQQLNAEEIVALPTGSFIQNLRLDGKPIDLKPVDALFSHDTITNLKQAGASLKSQGGQSLAIPSLSRRGRSASFEDCQLVTYLFEGPVPIIVPKLGKVYLGEFVLTRYSRRITMVRIELDTSNPGEVGDIVVASVEGNGHTIV